MLWDAMTRSVREGDIFQLHGGFCNIHRGHLRLNVGKQGTLTRLGQFNYRFIETNNISDKVWPETQNKRKPTTGKRKR